MAAIVESVLYFVLGTAIACVGIVSQSRSLRVLCAVAVPAIVALKLFPAAPHLGLPFPIADTWSKFLVIFALHEPSVLLIRDYRPSLEANAPWTAKARAAYKQVYNGRWMGTSFAAPGLTQKDEACQSSGSGKASRRMRRIEFFRKRVLTIVAIALFDMAKSYVVLSTISVGPRDVVPARTSYLRRLPSVTARETAIRCCLAFDAAWTPFALYTALHSILACIFVGAGLDEPEDWPPIFGSIADAYSIRRFWSKFYDRVVYRTLSTYAELLLRPLSAAPSGQRLTGWRRVVLNFLIFLFSGLLHAGVAMHMGFACGFREEVQWWCLNFVAIMFEAAVQSCFQDKTRKIPAVWEKVLGFTWVFAFLFWSVPKYQYLMMLCAPDAIDVFPGHPKPTDPTMQFALFLENLAVGK